MYTRLTWSALLLAITIVFYSWLPAAGVAGEFEQTHRRKIRGMVIAWVEFNIGFESFSKKNVDSLDRKDPAFKERATLRSDCHHFTHALFYSKFRDIVDHLDTSPFEEIGDIRKNREDTSIFRDPRKISVELKYVLGGLRYHKGFHEPLGDFAVEYARRPDLKERCNDYLSATGLR
jgi:hypothetical protein